VLNYSAIMLNVCKTQVGGREHCIIHERCLHANIVLGVGPKSGGRDPDGLFEV